ncbi:glycosyltransferase [Microbacterium sp.]|uniref:glycosyltransferase n=1 Tax=Microbacterium sp. TaxID=51671 RepID=UPI0039E2923D
MVKSTAAAALRDATAAVVLAYRPDESVVENVARIRDQVAHVYIVNNSPGDQTVGALAGIDPEAVTILDQAGNVGVAAGFNAGIRQALAAGSDHVVIFDQDSRPADGMIDRLLEVQAATPDAGIVAPALRSMATGVVYRRESGAGVAEVPMLISSGSLLSRALVERIGLHDEPLFIDYVDHDICLRARKAGLRNLKVFDAVLDHRFGDSDPVDFLGRQVYLANYSPRRIFFQTRNRIVVVRRYGFGRWFWEDLWFTAKAWTKVLLIESGRAQKVRAALSGVRAGLTYPARERHW